MGGGGGGYFPRATESLKELIEHQRKRARQDRLETAVNQLLRQTLASFERDPDEARDRLDKIEVILFKPGQRLTFAAGVGRLSDQYMRFCSTGKISSAVTAVVCNDNHQIIFPDAANR